MDINQLSSSQIEDLKRQIVEKERSERERTAAERSTYKALVNATVPEVFRKLQETHRMLKVAKERAFDDLESLIELKCRLYGVRDTQQSHTFSTADNRMSITLGYRVVDAWDDTVGSGVAKVKKYLKTLARDEESAALVGMITDLLKPDAAGNLKASRILDLRRRVDELGNPEIVDAVKIIQDAYRPVRTCSFIEAKWRDDAGREHGLPLSISAIATERDLAMNAEKNRP
jgi:hypothetical protein